MFKNDIHERRFNELLSRMSYKDEYHKAIAYLFSLNDECYKHIDDLFDFTQDCITPTEAFEQAWQTSNSTITTKLAYNLWNGATACNVDDVFCMADAPYFIEALKLRFPESL